MWWVYVKNSLMVLFIVMYCSCNKSNKDIIKLYLASSLTPLAEDIKALAANTPIDLQFLSSSAIVKQIEQGAPCDGVILADDNWSQRLKKSGHVGSYMRIIASNGLVLAANSSSISQQDCKSALMHIGEKDRLIIADPSYVPLGAYTKEVLEKFKVYHKLTSHFVFAHSARQASLLLKRGIGELAILYRTDAMSEHTFVVADIPRSLHRPVEYPFLVCKTARPGSVEFLSGILLSDQFRAALKAKGFGPG